ncbi:hypothetical protein AKJ40_02625 [candidate division MSBL1 archaeon SCGC-AAA259M10]|uniref:Indole-3-glycerol phosphate synthase n=2 Tax=candidate division MSBL1 TaxID=215777 RepID=A0A656YVL0_9EURY|nr:hypothetical protein AKJ39_03410 [candidate division MSBL1 archaeon SCGC-AAA259J03]KXA99682.1 hypothetical protein AKJ40_02625 [candidate division MSBL1 archaeon SCGC-AAA259M10]
MSILSEIVETVRRQVRKQKEETPVEEMKIEPIERKSLTENIETNPNTSIIGELKRTSPSSGVIREDFQPSELARSIAEGGAVGISVLTEPVYFDGKIEYLREVSNSVEVPVLRKDFIVEKYQLYQTAASHADSVLLIAEILGEELPEFVALTKELGMEPLVEVRDEGQVELAEDAEAKLVGINNRDLKSMEIDLSRFERIINSIPEGLVTVSESGIEKRQDVERVTKAGADAVLVGTAMMESTDVKGKVLSLIGDPNG